jgi:hypothetical protein
LIGIRSEPFIRHVRLHCHGKPLVAPATTTGPAALLKLPIMGVCFVALSETVIFVWVE